MVEADARCRAGDRCLDVGLKKVCLRHRVPVPPQSYWNKVQAGHKPRKILFRDVTDPALDRVHIVGGGNKLPADVAKALAVAKARESEPGHRIEVCGTPPTLPAAVRVAAAGSTIVRQKADELEYAAHLLAVGVRFHFVEKQGAGSVRELLLETFGLVCRADLENVRRTIA